MSLDLQKLKIVTIHCDGLGSIHPKTVREVAGARLRGAEFCCTKLGVCRATDNKSYPGMEVFFVKPEFRAAVDLGKTYAAKHRLSELSEMAGKDVSKYDWERMSSSTFDAIWCAVCIQYYEVVRAIQGGDITAYMRCLDEVEQKYLAWFEKHWMRTPPFVPWKSPLLPDGPKVMEILCEEEGYCAELLEWLTEFMSSNI